MHQDAKEWEKFWNYLRALEEKVERLTVEFADLRLDLDSERRRSIAVQRSSGRNKWTSLGGAIAAIIMFIAQWLVHK